MPSLFQAKEEFSYAGETANRSGNGYELQNGALTGQGESLASETMSNLSEIQNARVRKLLDWLLQREEEMAALLAELVAVPTENPPGRNYRLCADLLEKRLRQVGLECERLEGAETTSSGGDRPICLIASHGRGERVFYLHGHYDVVPAQSQEQFQPFRKDHFLFGRGACDMK